WPSPRENCHAAGRFSIAWLGVTAPGSLPPMMPEALQGPRCSIGWTGPGVPLGGGTPGSTAGWLIARADGHAHTVPGPAAARRARPARIIDSVPKRTDRPGRR